MPITVICNSCGKQLAAPDDAVGKSAACPQCGTRLTVPEEIADTDLEQLFGVASEPAVPPPNNPNSSAEKPGSNNAFLMPCPHCKIIVSIPYEVMNQVVKCPHCNQQFKIEGKVVEPPQFDFDFSPTNSIGALRRNIQKAPPVLRGMKIATLLWVAAIILNGALIYLSEVNSVIKISSNSYIRDNYTGGPMSLSTVQSSAIASAMLGAPWLPTYLYIPTMIVLFVFWFTDSRYGRTDK